MEIIMAIAALCSVYSGGEYPATSLGVQMKCQKGLLSCVGENNIKSIDKAKIKLYKCITSYK